MQCCRRPSCRPSIIGRSNGYVDHLIILIEGLMFFITIALGTALTSSASLLFAIIDPDAVYWAYGFPAAITAVVGADFVFAGGTLFIAKVSLPHEQSVAGAVFQCMTQVCHNRLDSGSSFG